MKLSIIMYHYVRELRYSRFPEIKALETEKFKGQIKYIKKHYNVIRADDLLAAVRERSFESLPPAPALLTFDDGYIDHFTQVFPILLHEKLPGCFFPPAKPILHGQVLDVNKIHFILAAAPDSEVLIDEIYGLLDEYRVQYQIESNDYYWRKLAEPKRFDPKEVVFIKRILQRELPEELSRKIITVLFQKYVTSDESAFAKELYMSADQIRCMHESGMYIGSHGYGHYWLNSLDPARQKEEVEVALDFLRRIGAGVDNGWIICYPYGAYDESLLSLLRRIGCKVGLTTKIGVADLRRDNLLTLPRLDTNDLPKSAHAPPDEWAFHAQEV